MTMSVLLKDLPTEDLPRERLLTYGAKNLTNEELVAIILRTGTINTSVKDLATMILSSAGDVTNLKYLTIKKMNEIKGLGDVKSATLLAALELGKRVYEENKLTPKVKVQNSMDAFKYFAKYIINDYQENFVVVYLDNQKQLINYKIVFKGTLNQSFVHPREIFKEGFLHSASAIICLHNHPSGNVNPSPADDELTAQLVRVGNIMGMQVLDHLIVGNGDYYSYIEKGKLVYE